MATALQYLLDLFCGAGGAAMGYYRAGFDIVGIDNRPQPRYPFPFIQGDALKPPVRLEAFDAIHASPPCQAHSRLRHLPWLKDRIYPALIEETRALLESSERPWVIENVEDAPLRNGVVVCGGTNLRRHRRFESSHALLAAQCAGHRAMQPGRAEIATRYRGHGIAGVFKEISRDSIAGHVGGIAAAREAMGIDWMRRDELAQAIPPAYTMLIGEQLMRVVRPNG